MENSTKNGGGCGCSGEDTCLSVSNQYASVSMPIKLRPYGMVGKIKTECCGEPVISFCACQNSQSPCGCEITITQTICIKIPLEYGAMADVGSSTVNCKKNT